MARMRPFLVALTTITLLAPAAPALAMPLGPGHAQSAPASAQSPAARSVPTLRVTRKIRGLDHPWDVQSIGQGRLLVTERDRADLLVWENGHKRKVRFPSGKVWVSGETGLMSMAIDPSFARTGRFYTCQGGKTPKGHEVHVVAWRLNARATKATRIKELLGGFPTSSGRHGGCRLLITRNGSLLVGTGDAAQGTNPENLKSLGGKTLRMNRMSGAPWSGNPFINSPNRNKRYVHSYGHRNVQGLAERKDGSLWSVEQGTYRDDEVNKLVRGGDYGYNPVPGYNEDVSMTDQSLPGKQINARWRSGNPTNATSGGSFVHGRKWGALNGAMAVAALKDEQILFLSFDAAGRLQRVRVPDALRHYGRLRSVTQVGGSLLITTDNGFGRDVVLRVRPS